MNKSFKPQVVTAQPKPLTEEQKKNQVLQFLAQKREGFAINILTHLCEILDKSASTEHALNIVDLSVEMADRLMEKLYPVKTEDNEKVSAHPDKA